MTLSEIKFEKDSFVESMVEKHPDLQAMREELSFWLKDPRCKLMGEWVCDALPKIEIDITVEDNFFHLTIFDTKDGEIRSTHHALLRVETDRLYYFIYKGKIVEIMIAGDMDEDGDEEGAEMYIVDYTFYHTEGTCEFYQQNQAMTDDDTIGIAAMKYVESDNSNDDDED